MSNKKQSFNSRVVKIKNEAIAFIESQLTKNKKIIRLCDPDEDGSDIYEMPDFSYWHPRGGFVDWCNIFKIAKEKRRDGTGGIRVYGIAKESGFTESVWLSEIDDVDVINLASHFQTLKHYEQTKSIN